MEARLTRRYATALYEVATRRGILPKVAQDVELVDAAFRSEARLAKALTNPQVPDDRKKAILSDLFASQVDPLTLQFCQLLIDRRRVDVLADLQAEFQRLSDKAAGIVRARVQTAIPLSKSQEERLVERLGSLTGKSVVFSCSVDPSIQGGAVVWIGDRVIDGSVAGYLSALEARLS